MDEEARAELLTFLVVSQLFAFARTGKWLRTGHLIESSQMWLGSNGAVCDWLERAQLVEACRVVAIKALDLPFPAVEADLVQLFNLNGGWLLDYRKPVVQHIHALSVATCRRTLTLFNGCLKQGLTTMGALATRNAGGSQYLKTRRSSDGTGNQRCFASNVCRMMCRCSSPTRRLPYRDVSNSSPSFRCSPSRLTSKACCLRMLWTKPRIWRSASSRCFRSASSSITVHLY